MQPRLAGAFIQILTASRDQWERDFEALMESPGLGHIELWVEHIPTVAERRFLKSLLQGVPLLVHGPFIHLSLASSLPQVRRLSQRRCEQAIDFSIDLGAKVMTIHGGSYPFFDSRMDAIERIADPVSRWSAMPDLTVAVENMPAKHGTTPEALSSLEDLAKLATLVPSVAFTLDVGHCVQNGEDYEAFVRRNSRKIADVQLHDAVPGGRAHLPAGKGVVDFKQVSALLAEVGYSGPITMENLDIEDSRVTLKAWLAAASVKDVATA